MDEFHPLSGVKELRLAVDAAASQCDDVGDDGEGPASVASCTCGRSSSI
jgi:hypothetical protein